MDNAAVNLSSNNNVLFLVVGTGSGNDAYFNTLCAAIDKSGAENIYLLLSKISIKIADSLKNKYSKLKKFETFCFDENNMEFDADKCFIFFDTIFQNTLNAGFLPENIIIDFTHGTKPMSAALYAIGMRYKINTFQYVVRQKDNNGSFIDGLEIVKTFDASYAKWLAIIDECKLLFKNWQFAAINLLLSGTKTPKYLKRQIEQIKILADFYRDWDRLDYISAYKNYPHFPAPAGFIAPDAGVQKLLEQLSSNMKEANNTIAEVLSVNDLEHNKQLAINLMFDIYANGLRRLNAGHLEDAGIRAYRLAELLGQIYLFENGYMSDYMSASDERVQKFADGAHIYKDIKSDIYKPFGRKTVISFLKFINHNRLQTEFLEKIEHDIQEIRNKSILIHGYSSKANDIEKLKAIFEALINQLRNTDNFENKKASALFMNKFKDIK